MRQHSRSASLPDPHLNQSYPLTLLGHRRARSDEFALGDEDDSTNVEEGVNASRHEIAYESEPGDLQFRDFTFTRYINQSQEDAALEYLRREFGVVIIERYEPFVALRCAGRIPQRPRPRFIGGLVAIWLTDDYHPEWYPFPADFGRDVGTHPSIDEDILEKFEANVVPNARDLALLADHLSAECSGVAWLANFIVLEFPKRDDEAWKAHLLKFPRFHATSPFTVLYSNGPLPIRQCMARAKIPRPELPEEEQVVDDTNYVARGGEFGPGSMINSAWNSTIISSATAGILVERKGEQRLTASWHVWEELAQKKGVALGDSSDAAHRVFTVYQGDTLTPVGEVVSRVGNTDIALIQLASGVKFRNQLIRSDLVARCLAHHGNLKYKEAVVIDGYTTGQHELINLGLRCFKSTGRESVSSIIRSSDEPRADLPAAGVWYVTASQGIYATDVVEMPDEKQPHIRARACGAVLIRSRQQNDVTGMLETAEATLLRGEVFGMVHHADIVHRKSNIEGVMMYCDSFSPLIAEGWTVVPLPRETSQLNVLEPDTIGDREESPRKRPRRSTASYD